MDLIAPLSKEQVQSYYTTPITPEEVKKEEEKVEEEVKVEEVKVEEVKEEEIKEEVKEEVKEEGEEVKEEEAKEEVKEEVKEVKEEDKEEEEVFDIKEILNGYRYSRPNDSVMLNDLVSSLQKEPVKTGPSVFPSVITEGLENKKFEYYEEIRQRHGVTKKEGLPPFVPVFVPVVVPMEKKEEKKVESKCMLLRMMYRER